MGRCSFRNMQEELSEKKNLEFRDTIKRPNISVVRVPEGMEGEVGLKDVFSEIINDNFPGKEAERGIQI